MKPVGKEPEKVAPIITFIIMWVIGCLLIAFMVWGVSFAWTSARVFAEGNYYDCPNPNQDTPYAQDSFKF